MTTGAPKVYLFFLSGANKGKIAASDAKIIRIGRQPYCEVTLDPYQDLPASGEHARIVCQPDGTFTLFDCNSSWGTYKNEVRLTGPVAVITGDVVTLGLDDTGRQGPSIKFYLETDILRCPACEGPVYKRHFKCPRCKRKACLRCIDFQLKLCNPCASKRATAQGGYEIVTDDDVAARAPARVVVSGKDAKRVRRAQANRAKKAASKKPLKKIKQTKVVGGGQRRGRSDDPGVITEAAGSFCMVCCAFVTRPTFCCPSCDKECCKEHQHGRVCSTCAGVDSAQLMGSAFKAGRGTEPELRIPDLSNIPTISAGDAVFAPPPRLRHQPSPGGSGQRPELPQRPVAGSGFEQRRPVAGSGFEQRRPVAGSGSSRFAPERPVAGSGYRGSSGTDSARFAPGQPVPPAPPRPARNGESKINARPPLVVPCERSGCTAPLDPRSFFICGACRLRLCPNHRTATGSCDQCVSSARAAPLPQFGPLPVRPQAIPNTMRMRRRDKDPHEMTTVHDEPSPLSPQGMLETADDSPDSALSKSPGLGDVTFECPYCENQLPPHARSCHHCKTAL